MLNHVVLVTLNEGVPEEQVAAALAALAALPAAIPQIRSFDCGRNAGLNPNSVDLALIAKFDNVEDYNAYREHPLHQAFGRDHLLPISQTRTIIQFFGQD
jgi:hypothetical protein